ncbi:MAG: hypothetical protein EOO24_28800 [Comamonadaceae bacterium]|nr:MAG: hypothetical protein EOO24_28800 [Comamonadaceae bacterium]
MTTPAPVPPIRGYAFSVRTLRGRLVIRVEQAALRKLGARADDRGSALAALHRHMARLHVLALQLTAHDLRCEVTINARDVWWAAGEPGPAARQTARAGGRAACPPRLSDPAP